MKTLVTAALIAVSAVVYGSPAGRPGLDADREAVIGLEQEWLGALHDRATLERVLADDFVHPVPTGDFGQRAGERGGGWRFMAECTAGRLSAGPAASARAGSSRGSPAR